MSATDCDIATADSTTAMDDTSSTPSDRGITTSDGTSAMDDASSTTSSCIAETEACLADSECLGCAQSATNAGTACLSSDFDSETATCSEILENACCLFEEIPECLDDNLLVAWLGGRISRI